jgi:hypothetical protein
MPSTPVAASVSARFRIASLVLVACSLLSTIRIVRDAPTRANASEISKRSDERFSALKAELPQRGVVGYIGEAGTPALADYYLAQYALAPLVVDDSPNHPLVVGNFPGPASDNASKPKLRLVRDFGDGVKLYANQDTR